MAAADLRTVKETAQIAAAFPARAQLRVLNVWAMWCIPCVAEMPDLRAIDDAFGPEVAIAGLSLDDMLPNADRAKTASFLDKQKIAFPNLYYTGNPDELAEHLKFDGEIPVTIVYDRNGKELWRHSGRLKRDETIARLREMIGRTK
ncbi:MAG TPA: TlpA disulfide reductase family protein [Thermoanaerobaculia bacterium]|nr:TlpA disulfide reductase family protein [Thermoanaerobaculia bacterium]